MNLKQMKKELSHVKKDGKARMVDIGNKNTMKRKAVAEGKIFLHAGTIELIKQNQLKKGDVLTVAQIAGIQAAKKTSELIPLCHPLEINYIDVQLTVHPEYIQVIAIVECNGRTGVEMEAITAVQIALVTVYDMCKAVDKEMVIGEIKLTEKIKSGL